MTQGTCMESYHGYDSLQSANPIPFAQSYPHYAHTVDAKSAS